MRRRAPSLHQAIWPCSEPEFDEIASAWPDEVIVRMLGLVWEGFDQMKSSHFHRIDFNKPIEQLERGLTDLHMDEISLLWRLTREGFESFIPKHEAWEFRTRASPSSKPPSTDIGFVLVANRSLRWSVEAKVLEHPGDVTRYLVDLTEKYLTGKGSPLSAQAALAGYLRRGVSEDVFPHLEKRLSQRLDRHHAFPKRAHRLSRHRRRAGSSPETEASDFLCHHLILGLS